MITKHLVIPVLLLFALKGLSAQEYTYTGNPDLSYLTARDLAFEGNRSEARDTLVQVLTRYPDYVDVHCLLAKTGQGEYE